MCPGTSAMVAVAARDFTGGDRGRCAGSLASGNDDTGVVMIDGPYLVLTVLGVLGCGLVAGVFYGFSAFVMRGLAELPPHRVWRR